MNFVLQYEVDGELVTKVSTAKEIIELFGYSDFNCAENITVFYTKEIGVFTLCKILHSHHEVVDDFGHLDMWCNIVNAETKEVLASASYEEH